jgi:hypothetical protein
MKQGGWSNGGGRSGHDARVGELESRIEDAGPGAMVESTAQP